MSTQKLKAEKRDLTGRKLKKLRKDGFLPANIYGKNVDSMSLQVNHKDFKATYKEAGETGIISLEIGSDVRPVLVSNIQLHPMTDEPLHVDFRQVNLKEKIQASVPVILVGESPAEKQSLGTVVLQLNEIEVEALPADLPEKFEVNVEVLTDVDQAIYVKDLKVSSDVEIKTDIESIVAKVEPPQKEEVIETPAAEPAEGEAVVEGAPEAENTQTEESKG